MKINFTFTSWGGAMALLIFFNAQVFSQNTFPPSGNVGIGTTTPTKELEVKGTIKADTIFVTNLNVNQSVQIGSFSFTNGSYQTFPNITDSIRTPYSMSLSSDQKISLDADNVSFGTIAVIDRTNGQLNVAGNISASGNISSGTLSSAAIQTQQLNIIGSAGRVAFDTWGRLSVDAPQINNTVLYLGRIDSTSSVQEICTHDGDLLLQSHTGLTSNTLINSDNSGYVGIGTNTPQEKLSVQGNSFISGNMRIGNLIGSGDRQVMVDANGNLKVITQSYCGGGNPWGTQGNGNTLPTDFIGTCDAKDLVFKTNGVERMRIYEGGVHPGNVGIGTTTPEKKLHVVTTHTLCPTCTQSHEGIRVEENTTYTGQVPVNATNPNINAWDLQPYAVNEFAFRLPGQSPAMTIAPAGASIGKLGFNNTNYEVPGRLRLDVAGDARFSSTTSDSKYVRIGHNGVNGLIDIFSDQPNDGLLINYYSNRNIAIGNIQDPNPSNVTIAGNLGIGIAFSSARLEVKAKDNSSANYAVNVTSTAPAPLFAVRNDGKVSIGIMDALMTDNYNNTNLEYKLYVEGGIMTEHIRVAYKGLNNGEWGDWVFEKDNKRMNFEEQFEYYLKNKHLKGIPSAKEIKNKGIDVSDMFANVVINLEEARLDNIELYKQNEAQKKEIDAMKVQMQILQKQIDELKRK